VARATALPRAEAPAAPASRIGFGLRPRLLGALALTSVVTLGVAALALLPPLKARLRSDALTRAVSAVNAAKPRFAGVALLNQRPPAASINIQAHRLHAQRVVIWASAPLRRPLYDSDLDAPTMIARNLAKLALARSNESKPRHRVHDGLLVVASAYSDGGKRYVLEVFTRLDYVEEATDVVTDAFLEAAAAGLAVALLLGAALSSRLVRRLQLLRDATSGVDEGGLSDLIVAEDRVRDEIGELARAFAQMRLRLHQQEDARRAFVATASHELRTPLTSLDGMLELIADDLNGDPVDLDDARERIARAQEQSRRLSSLASDLLDLSRIDAELALRSEPVELGEVARAVSAEFELRAAELDVALTIDGAEKQRWAEGDPGGVARIVRILLDNALRIAPAHSTITIRVGTAAGPSSIEVSDSGPGVPADERELIFERFQRGKRRSGEGGFGLGLAIGRELSARMGGTLELVGEPPGATFRLRLNPPAEGTSNG
jgi:signal transduction histidine kinase